MKLIRGKRRNPAPQAAIQYVARQSAKKTDPQTIAAQESARQAARSVRAAYIASALNVLVIGVALLVPAAQRTTATFEKQVELRQQDIRAISATGSLVENISILTMPGGIFDEEACLQDDPLNAYDQARLGLTQRRSDDLRSQVFAQGIATSTQFAEEAAMVKMTYALETARTIVPIKASSSFGKGTRSAFCLASRNDLIQQARDAKMVTLDAIDFTFAPITGTILDKDPMAKFVTQQGAL